MRTSSPFSPAILSPPPISISKSLTNMRQSGRYDDSNVNPIMTGQMLHQTQRMQFNNQGAGMNQYPGRSDSFRPEEERQYVSPKSEAQWQWDRDGSRGPLSHTQSEGPANNVSRSSFQSQWSDSRQPLERKDIGDSKITAHQQEGDIRYDGGAFPESFESLEQKFFDDIAKLIKEQQHAEDAENARHRQRLTEINAQYQDKLSAMRSRQAADRDDFLRKESQARHLEFQQVNLKDYQNKSGPGEYYGFGTTAPDAVTLGEAHRSYGGNQPSVYRDRAQFSGVSRDRGFESRGPYPGGRAYNSGGRRF